MNRTLTRALFAAFLLATGALASAQSATTAPTDLDRASALFDKKQYKDAVALLNQIIAKDRSNARVFVLRGDALDNLGDTKGAMADYNTAIGINPNYEYAYATRCGTENELSEYRAAVDDCTKAISLDTSDDMGYRERAIAYFFLGDYELSSGDAEKSIALDGSNPWNMVGRCRADVALGHLDTGLKACNVFIGAHPDYATGYFYRARVEMQQAQIDAAVADFKKTLANDDTFDAAHYWLAVIALDQKQYGVTVSEAQAYLDKNPNDADSLLLRAKAEWALGKTDQAKYDARESLRQYQISNDTDGMKSAQSFIDQISKP